MAEDTVAEAPRRKTLLFSDRHAIMDAIADPASVTPRKSGEKWVEHEAHWQARAVLGALAAKGLLAGEYEA